MTCTNKRAFPGIAVEADGYGGSLLALESSAVVALESSGVVGDDG